MTASVRFGPCRPAHMRGASVVAPEDGGDTLPAFEDPAEGGPTVAVAGEAGAGHPHEPVGDDGNERTALGPDGLAVIYGTQTGFGFGKRKTASMSVGVMRVRHRAASTRSVRLAARRRYAPGWVIIDPCSGRREEADGGGVLSGRVGVDR